MPLDVLKLVRDMDSLSRATWERVMIGDFAGLKFREDSITDELLFTLMQRHPQLAVRRLNQSEEYKAGADWEWWIGSGRFGWFRLKIQAKRVHGKKYEELDHRGNVEAGHEFQYQTLIAGCRENSTYPFHVFFNGWPQDRFIETFVSDHTDPCGPLDQELWGCAVMSSHSVVDLHLGSRGAEWSKRSSVPRYMPASLPWSRLFTWACTNAIANYPDGFRAHARTPEQIFRSLHMAVILLDGLGRGEVSHALDPRARDWASNTLLRTPLITELPAYASKTLAAHSYFLEASDFTEENPNFLIGPDDAPPEGMPDVLLLLDVEGIDRSQ
jgi:hypothetical protein